MSYRLSDITCGLVDMLTCDDLCDTDTFVTYFMNV